MEQIDNLYEFSYHYVETPVEHRDGFNDKHSWYYPELKNIINGLQQKWDTIDIPLNVEIFDKRILIKHKTPENIGSLAQLKISAYLAFMLGYTEEIEEFGQYLRFDQNQEYLAPHEPKLFLDYCNTGCPAKLFPLLFFEFLGFLGVLKFYLGLFSTGHSF